MMYRTRQAHGSFSFGGSVTPAVKWLLIVNIAVFVLQLPYMAGRPLLWIFGLVPQLVWNDFHIWQLFTYQFLHFGLFHILFNMLALWMFGCDLERSWGSQFFLKYYWVAVVGGGLCVLFLEPNQAIPTIGASAGIYGVLLAYGRLYPNNVIYLYMLFPIRMKYFVLIIGAIAFFSSISPGNSGISHLGHLGGMLFGYLYLKWGYLLNPRRSWATAKREYYRFRLARLKRRFRVIDGKKQDDEPPTLH